LMFGFLFVWVDCLFSCSFGGYGCSYSGHLFSGWFPVD